MDSKVLPIFAIILLNGIVMSLPTTSNNIEDRRNYRARNGREDTFDFMIEEPQLREIDEEREDIGEDRRFYRARNGREDTFDFKIEEPQPVALRYHLKDRLNPFFRRRWNGRAHRRSIKSSERNGEIEEAAIDRLASQENENIGKDRSRNYRARNGREDTFDFKIEEPQLREIDEETEDIGADRRLRKARRMNKNREINEETEDIGEDRRLRKARRMNKNREINEETEDIGEDRRLRKARRMNKSREINEETEDIGEDRRLRKARRMNKNREIDEGRNGEIEENVDERGNTRCNAPFYCSLILNAKCECTCSCSKKRPTRPSRPSPPEDNDYRGA